MVYPSRISRRRKFRLNLKFTTQSSEDPPAPAPLPAFLLWDPGGGLPSQDTAQGGAVSVAGHTDRFGELVEHLVLEYEKKLKWFYPFAHSD